MNSSRSTWSVSFVQHSPVSDTDTSSPMAVRRGGTSENAVSRSRRRFLYGANSNVPTSYLASVRSAGKVSVRVSQTVS